MEAVAVRKLGAAAPVPSLSCGSWCGRCRAHQMWWPFWCCRRTTRTYPLPAAGVLPTFALVVHDHFSASCLCPATRAFLAVLGHQTCPVLVPSLPCCTLVCCPLLLHSDVPQPWSSGASVPAQLAQAPAAATPPLTHHRPSHGPPDPRAPNAVRRRRSLPTPTSQTRLARPWTLWSRPGSTRS